MAESAAILAGPHQKVYHPVPKAGCPLAEMGDVEEVKLAWEKVKEIIGNTSIIPITYVNSSVELKAFTGEHGGSCCTSSNAESAFKWGFKTGEKIFFFPDEHLGKNTAKKMGIPKNEVIVWDWEQELGGNSLVPSTEAEEEIKKAKLLVWKGYCHVHTRFTAEHVKQSREKYPNAVIIVHPECKEEVVDAADHAGSTEYMVKFVENASSGSTTVIGTEINLISRLARDYPDKKIIPLTRSLCPNMFRISAEALLWTLENLNLSDNIVKIPEKEKSNARLALQRMLLLQN